LFCEVQFLKDAGVVPSEEEEQRRERVVSELEKVRVVHIFGLKAAACNVGPSGTYNPLVAVADSDGLGEVGSVRTGGTTLAHNRHGVDLWLL
jgi:hypothetical protein